ncbi:MAG: hypothetical protein ACYS21_21415 [Planctomycetota bacterium]
MANEIHVNNNNLSGNTYGVNNELTNGTVLDASDNWWGSSNGPTIASNTFNVGSQGVEILESQPGTVDYVQWLDSDGDGAGMGFQRLASLTTDMGGTTSIGTATAQGWVSSRPAHCLPRLGTSRIRQTFCIILRLARASPGPILWIHWRLRTGPSTSHRWSIVVLR